MPDAANAPLDSDSAKVRDPPRFSIGRRRRRASRDLLTGRLRLSPISSLGPRRGAVPSDVLR
eukprot:3292903-Alexandrium_andersonii.AAC.1